MLLFGKEPQLFLPQSRAIFVKFADTGPRGPEGILWLWPPRGVYRPAAGHHRPRLARDLGRDGQALHGTRPAAPGRDRVPFVGRARGAGQCRRPPRLPADRAQHRDPHVHRPHGDHQPRRPPGAHHGGQHRRGALQPQPAPRQRPLPVGLYRGVGSRRRPHDRGHGARPAIRRPSSRPRPTASPSRFTTRATRPVRSRWAGGRGQR